MGGEWVLLGRFNFGADGKANVTVRNGGGKGFVIADAVKFVESDADPTLDKPRKGTKKKPRKFPNTLKVRGVNEVSSGVKSRLADDPSGTKKKMQKGLFSQVRIIDDLIR